MLLNCVVSFAFVRGIKKCCHADIANFDSAYFHLGSPNPTGIRSFRSKVVSIEGRFD